jgi:ABC-2 type transport system ATP-binding protein
VRDTTRGAETKPAVLASALTRTFGATQAVKGVDLTVQRGEIYGFLGPNGAGKTTVVRMLCTLLRPTTGAANVAGFDVVRHAADVRLRIGVALQEAALDPEQTGRELLELQARLFGLRASDTRARIAELTDLVDIGAAIDRTVKTYSGGMRRRLDLALALVHEPEILFLDEPTTGLDPVSRRQIWAEVDRLNRSRGLTVFLTTQYLEEADALAGRVGIIAGGQIVAEGSSDELKRRVGRDIVVVILDAGADAAQELLSRAPGIERIERSGSELALSVSNGPAALPVVATMLAGAQGVAVREMALRRPTLDDAFFALTGHAAAPDDVSGDAVPGEAAA